MTVWVLLAAAALAAGNGATDNRDVKYGPPPSWISPPPSPTSAAAPSGAAARVIFTDRQDRLFTDRQESYTAYRVKILAPQALGVGNITAAWNPSTDELTVNELHVIRDGQVIDVLTSSKFRVIEREDNLEYAVFDGTLTATLQTPGLQVGDELEFAATVRRCGRTFAGKASSLLLLPYAGSPGAYRLRVSWPVSMPVRWQATPDVGKLAPRQEAGEQQLEYELRDPGSVVVADGAPGRYNLRRLVEYTQFTSWTDLARLLSPLFDRAATLAPDSPVRLEVAKIAASTKDPVQRTEAALRLVEDRIRYVFVGLDGGDYLPASADVTWSRRFGDCKAKSVLLAAVLRELGVASEVVLVNSKGGDGTNERLPTPALFDHAVVRAMIGSKIYWLDGTRLGDRRLAALPAPVFRWDLPLRANGDLEAVSATPPALALSSSVVDIDASAGFDKPAKVGIEHVIRDDTAGALERELANLTGHDAQEALRQYWRASDEEVQPDKLGWRYDFLQNILVLTVSGTTKPDWRRDDKGGRMLYVLGAGFTPPSELRRPVEQEQSAPWITHFPHFDRWTTIVRLPRDIGKWRWDFSDAPVHKHLGGVSYWREADLKDGVLRSTMSIRTLSPEISSADAKAINDGIAQFDNSMSTVFETKSARGDHAAKPGPDADYSALRRMQSAALLKAGRPDEALTFIDELIARDPEEAANLRARAAVLTALGRHEEALDDLDEAWRINPLDPVSLGARADALQSVSRSQDVGAPYDPWQAGGDTVATDHKTPLN